jgi:hypothetical protein
VTPAEVDRLVGLGILVPRDGPGPFLPADAQKVRLAVACEQAGLPVDGIAAAIRAGRLSFGFLEAAPFRRWAVRSARTYRLDILGAEDIIERPAELPVAVADEEPRPVSLLLQVLHEVAGLLSDPGGVGVGGHAGQMDAAGVQFDEEQHVQPSQPDGIDGEEVAGQDSGGLLAKKRPPAGVCPPWRGVEAVAAERLFAASLRVSRMSSWMVRHSAR